MNKNTIIGASLIGLLFVWSMYNANQQQEAMDAKAKQAAVVEKSRQDSLAAIKGTPTTSGVPELVAPSANNASTNASLSAALDAAAQDPLSAAAVASAAKDSTVDSATAPATIAQRSIVVETDNFTVTLDNRGAMVRSVIPKTLANPEGQYPELIQFPEKGALSLQFDKADFSQALFTIPTGTPDHIVVTDKVTLSFTWKDAQGRSIVREYRFSKDGLNIGHATYIHGFKPKLYTIEWNGGLKETEPFPTGKGFGMTSYFFSEVVFDNTYNVERHTISEQTWFNKDQGKASWFGLRRKYIAALIQFPQPTEASLGASPIKLDNPQDPGTYNLVVSDLMTSDSIAFDLVILPLQWNKIDDLGHNYEKIIVSGWEWIGADKWFVWMCGFILKLLNIFYTMVPNYGVAIILLTVLVKLATTPLALKQMRSTRDMMKLKPELDAIRVKYRADMRAQQQEIMALYARHGISPFSGMAGCLPMFLQMPIFIGLFVVLGRAIELRGAPFALWIHDLSKSDVVWHGISIPYVMPEGLTILPFVMVVTTFFQTKQTVTDPNQKAMIYMMPAMMFFFSAVMPSGLVLYWIVSNLWGIAQYMIINRKGSEPTAVKNGKGKLANVVDAEVVSKRKNK